MPLVSIEEFKENFACPFKYGDTSKPWPRKTILVYRYSSNGVNKSIKFPENTWIRLDNEPYGRHAEIIMLDFLEMNQKLLEGRCDVGIVIHSIEVIQNYSPCYSCSAKLCSFKTILDKKTTGYIARLGPTTDFIGVKEIKFQITFSNFYMHTEKYENGPKNIEGLKDLLNSDIKLDTFTDKGQYYFNATGLLTERQKRENDDKKILQYLKQSVGIIGPEEIEVTKAYLQSQKLI